VRGRRVTGRIEPFGDQEARRTSAPRSPRVHAAGASPSPYAAPHCVCRAQKPPRSRGGSFTFALRRPTLRLPRAEAPAFTRWELHLRPTPPHTASATRRSPRVHAVGASPSPYAAPHCVCHPGSPRVHAVGASPSPYAPHPAQPAQKPPRSRGGSFTFALRAFASAWGSLAQTLPQERETRLRGSSRRALRNQSRRRA
jgi:hypothetical protein